MSNTTVLNQEEMQTEKSMDVITKFLEAFLLLTHCHWQMETDDAWSLFAAGELVEKDGKLSVDLSSEDVIEDMMVFHKLATLILEAPNPLHFNREWLMTEKPFMQGLAPVDLILSGQEGIIGLTVHIRNEILLQSLAEPAFGMVSYH